LEVLLIIELLQILFVGWGPYAYFKMLEESRASTQAAIAVNLRSAQAVQPQVDDKQDERSIHGCMGISIAPNSGSALEDIESGRR
jgi:diacylglycerol diphosphate phosphatase/phosphatidate phosphatase